MILTFLDEAISEIAESTNWFDRQSRGLGAEFRKEIDQVLESITVAPESFARFEFLGARRGKNVRRAITARFSQVIVFAVREAEIVVVAVYHSRRHPKYWTKRLGRKS